MITNNIRRIHWLTLATILTALIIAIVYIIGCSSGNNNKSPTAPTNTFNIQNQLGYGATIEDKLSVVLTGNPEIGLIAVHENKEMLAIMTESDTSGNIRKVTGTVLMLPSGETMVVFAGNNGLPSQAVIGNYIFLYSNYTDNTVDVTMISPDGTSTVTPHVLLDPRVRTKKTGESFKEWYDQLADLVKSGARLTIIAGAAVVVVWGTPAAAAFAATLAVEAFVGQLIDVVAERWYTWFDPTGSGGGKEAFERISLAGSCTSHDYGGCIGEVVRAIGEKVVIARGHLPQTTPIPTPNATPQPTPIPTPNATPQPTPIPTPTVPGCGTFTGTFRHDCLNEAPDYTICEEIFTLRQDGTSITGTYVENKTWLDAIWPLPCHWKLEQPVSGIVSAANNAGLMTDPGLLSFWCDGDEDRMFDNEPWFMLDVGCDLKNCGRSLLCYWLDKDVWMEFIRQE